MVQEPFDGRGVEQVAPVIEVEDRRLGAVQHVDRDVELGVGDDRRALGDLQARGLGGPDPGVEVEDRVDQRRPRPVVGNPQRAQQAGQGIAAVLLRVEDAVADGGQIGREGRLLRPFGEPAAVGDQVDAVADQPVAPLQGTPGRGAADHEVVLPGPAVQQRGPGGEQRHVERGAVAAAELAQALAQGGIEPARPPAAEEAALRRARPVGRRLEDRQLPLELPEPVRLVAGALSAPGGQPGHVLPELQRPRQRRPAASARRLVDRDHVAEHDGDRQAVGRDVMDEDPQTVQARLQPQHGGADQRAVLEVEDAQALGLEPGAGRLLPARRGEGGDIDQRHLEGELGEDHLHGLGARRRRRHDGAQGLVAVDGLLKGVAELVHLQRAAQLRHARLQVGQRGLFAEERHGVEIALLLRQRHAVRLLARADGGARRLAEAVLERGDPGQAGAHGIGLDPEVDQAGDLVDPEVPQALHDRGAGLRRADQRRGPHIALVGQLQHVLEVFAGEAVEVDRQALARDHVLDQADRGLQIAVERRPRRGDGLLRVGADEGVQQQRHVGGFGRMPGARQGLAVDREVGGQPLDRLPHQVGQHAGAHLARLAVGVRVVDDGDPDRQVAPRRQRVDAQVDLGARAVADPHRLAAPELADGLGALEHQIPVAAIVLRRQGEVVGVPARGVGQAHPAAREVVHQRPLLGHPHRVVQGQHDAAGAQGDASGLTGQRRRQHRRVGAEAPERVEVALGEPERREAVAVAEAGAVEEQVVLVRPELRRVVAEEVQAELDPAVRGRSGDVGERARRGGRIGGSGGRGSDRRLDPLAAPEDFRLRSGGRSRHLAPLPAAARAAGPRVGQESAAAQLLHALFHRAYQEVQVLVRVRGREEAVAPLPDVHPLLHHVVVEELGIGGEVEPEERVRVHGPDRHLVGLEEPVQALGEAGGAGVQGLLQRRPLLLQIAQHLARRGHGQRVLAEGAAEEGGVALRPGVVAEAPHAAVDAVHVLGRAGHDADRQAAAHDLAVGRDIGPDAEVRLRPAQVEAEAADHLVEDQGDAGLGGQLPQVVEELHRLQVRPPALDRLDEHRGDFRGLLADDLQRPRRAVVEHQDVLGHLGRDARRHREGAQLAVDLLGLGQGAVRVAMVGAGEHDELVAAGAGAGQPDGRHARLGARVGERRPLHAGQLAEQRRHLAGVGRPRPDLEPLPHLPLVELLQEVRRVAEQVDAHPHGDVDVLVAIDVPDPRALAARPRQRVEHLLVGHAEADRGAAVRQPGAVLLGQLLGLCRLPAVALDQGVQVLLLALVERAGRLATRLAQKGRQHRFGGRDRGGGRGLGGRSRRRDCKDCRDCKDTGRSRTPGEGLELLGDQLVEGLDLQAHHPLEAAAAGQRQDRGRGGQGHRSRGRQRAGHRGRHRSRSRHRGRSRRLFSPSPAGEGAGG